MGFGKIGKTGENLSRLVTACPAGEKAIEDEEVIRDLEAIAKRCRTSISRRLFCAGMASIACGSKLL